MKRYYFTLPGYFHAIGPIAVRSKEAAKQWIRDWLKVKRLPNHTEIWETR